MDANSPEMHTPRVGPTPQTPVMPNEPTQGRVEPCPIDSPPTHQGTRPQQPSTRPEDAQANLPTGIPPSSHSSLDRPRSRPEVSRHQHRALLPASPSPPSKPRHPTPADPAPRGLPPTKMHNPSMMKTPRIPHTGSHWPRSPPRRDPASHHARCPDHARQTRPNPCPPTPAM